MPSQVLIAVDMNKWRAVYSRFARLDVPIIKAAFWPPAGRFGLIAYPNRIDRPTLDFAVREVGEEQARRVAMAEAYLPSPLETLIWVEYAPLAIEQIPDSANLKAWRVSMVGAPAWLAQEQQEAIRRREEPPGVRYFT